MPACNPACNIANLRLGVLGAFSSTKALQASNPFLFGTRCTSLKLRPLVSVANRAYSVWLHVGVNTEVEGGGTERQEKGG